MHGSVESGACHWSFGCNAPKVWVAYRELFTPRLRSSAGSGKRRRREGPSGPTNWLVLILGRLENYTLFPVPPEPDTILANIPLNTKTKDKRNEIDAKRPQSIKYRVP